MERNEITTIDGREYVSVEEFVRRMDTSRQTLEKRIRLGIIPVVRPDGKRRRFIDWELGSKAWNMNPPNMKNVEAQRLAKRRNKDSNDSFMSTGKTPGKPRVDSPQIPSLENNEIQNERLMDISEIDPKLIEDCTINGVTDWDLAKKKLTALTYAYDLDIKKGKYIEKAEVQRWALALSKILESNLSAIPNKYASILEAEVVSITRRLTGKAVEMTDEMKSEMRGRMEDVAPEIFKAIQKNLEEYNDEE